MKHDICKWIEDGDDIRLKMRCSVVFTSQIERAIKLILNCLYSDGKILACGNGGSSGDSSHLVGELLNRFTKLREYPLPAIDLSAPNGTITAIANDYSFDEVFSKQIEALGKSNDVLIAISTSGTSRNILRAVETALSKGMKVIFLTGDSMDIPDFDRMPSTNLQPLMVPSKVTPLIQEAHITIIHIICHMVDKALEEK